MDTGGRLPFEGSEEIADIIRTIITSCAIESFVETGTQRGASVKWVAENFPHLHVVTIELSREYYLEAFENLIGTKVTQMIGSSPECLLRLRFRNGERVLFFLDAHGCETERTPILEELESIRLLMVRDAIIPSLAIHDFQVPGRPELGFDRYPNQVLNLDYIGESLLNMGFEGKRIRFNTVADGAARGLCYITSV